MFKVYKGLTLYELMSFLPHITFSTLTTQDAFLESEQFHT